MNKLLSVIVPSYNATKYLDKCLTSFICPRMDEIDVIIINDGSTDDTPAIAQKYVDRYPGTFRLVSKENGGHGSGINTGTKLAIGKYLKVVDADDWVITENLPEYLDKLASTDADAIFTNFNMVDMTSGAKTPYINVGAEYDKLLYKKDLMSILDKVVDWFTIHRVSYKTSFYNSLDIAMSEKIFYEDTEFVTLPFTSVETLQIYDMFLYEYMVGNVSQSVSGESFRKRYSHCEIILDKLVDHYLNKTSDDVSKRYMILRIAKMLGYYETIIYVAKDRSAMRKRVGEFVQKVGKSVPEAVEVNRKQYRKYKILSYTGLSYESLSSVYHKILRR